MKKTLTINLNKIVFHIDEDAYQLLRSYLDEIANHFQKSDEKNDIMFDIEARISELFSEKTKSQSSVITIEDVEEVIETMGKPSQYTEEEEYDGDNNTQNNNREYSYKAHRKLYRDIDNDMLGGVLSGLAAYLNWDVTALRIAFILLVLFTSGTFIFIYIIMWMVVPKAISISQKMEMRGEHVTIDSLNKKKVDTELNDDNNLYRGRSNSRSHSFLKVLLTIFLVGFVGIIVIPVLFSLIVAAFALLIALPAAILGIGSAFWVFPDITPAITSISTNSLVMLTIASLLIVATPIFILVYWLKGRNQKEERSSTPYWIALLLLFVGIFMFAGSGTNIIRKLSNNNINWNNGIHWNKNWKVKINGVEYSNFDGVKINNFIIDEEGNVEDKIKANYNMDSVKYNKNYRREVGKFHKIDISKGISLYVMQCDTTKVIVKPNYNTVKTEVEDGTLKIYRTENKIDSLIPMMVYVDSLAYLNISDVSRAKYREEKYTSNLKVNVEHIGQFDGNFATKQKVDIKTSGASKVKLTGMMNTVLANTSGTSWLKVKIPNDIENQLFNIKSSGLSRVELEGKTKKLLVRSSGTSRISTTELRSNNAEVKSSGASKVELNGITDQLSAHLSGTSKLKASNLRSVNIDIESSGASKVKLEGKTEKLFVRSSGTGKVKAFDCNSKMADVKSSGAGKIEVSVTKELKANASGASKIKYKGNPTTLSESETGAGKISQIN